MTIQIPAKHSVTKRALTIGLTGAIACTALWAQASDHVDFPDEELTTGKTGDPVSDVADLYAFTSPESKDNLVLIMTVNPGASSLSRFSDQVNYSIRLRPAQIDGAGFSLGEEHNIVCSFDAELEQNMTCSFDGDLEVSAKFNDGDGASYGKQPVRAFAGLRQDQFAIDLISIQATALPAGPLRDGFRKAHGIEDLTTTIVMPSESPINVLGDKNTLSIVLEFSPESVFGVDSSMFAVVAETSKKGL